jgi:two-component system chemotaxis response regulator CheY
MAYNILIVDDSLTVRKMIAKTLTLSGVPLNEPFQAENGREALSVLEDNWVDLVLTDINMPEMNGMEMVRHMSEDALLQTVPVVVISTEGSDERIQELKERGIQGYIRKPFTPEAIKDKVEEILGGPHDG